MSEEWRPVVGYEGLYEVSDLGYVRSLDRVIVCKTGQRQTRYGRVMVPHLSKANRRTVVLSREATQRTVHIYRLVLEAFVGPCPAGMEACHTNGDSSDDRLANLRWDTKSANAVDQIRHGRHHEARKTHCRRGHELADYNIVPAFFRLRRERACLACWRAKCNARYAKKMGRIVDVDALAAEQYARIKAAA